MGQNSSIALNSYQEIVNQITQISNEQCINFCTNSSNFKFNLSGGQYGNITASSICAINSASCNLKASLDAELLNSITNRQKSKIEETGGLFGFLDQLASVGSNRSIDQDNYGSIVNQITQELNSLCLTEATANNVYEFTAVDAKVRNVNFESKSVVSKSSCIIDNMTRFYASNSLENDQEASIIKSSLLGGLLLLLVIIIIAIYVIKHIGRSKKVKDNDAEEIAALALAAKN